MQKIGPFDVIVVGSGITGLSTVYHLLRHGVQHLALAAPAPAHEAATNRTAGFAVGGQLDNFTRISHIHGVDKAKELWAFGDHAFKDLMTYCRAAKVEHSAGRRLRLIASEHELIEARQAVAELRAAKLAGDLKEPAVGDPLGKLCGPRILAVQDDGPCGSWVNTAQLLQTLEHKTRHIPRLPAVEAIHPGEGKVRLQLKNSADQTKMSDVSCEMVVLAAHLGIRPLLPELADALISVADQWTEYRLTKPFPDVCQGVAFTVDNTYEWGVFCGKDRVHLGGGRYLRPMAGIEAKTASMEGKIVEHLRLQLEHTFSFAAGAQPLQTQADLDINPCDELPIIGPMFGDGRVLVGTGYMGSGLTLGFNAGRCLAELIALGKSPSLPRCLWPERLRSLES